MIIFIGVPGSGKSTQGKMLADKLKLPWLSTGEFLRMLVSGERRASMLRGELLEDGEIIALVQKIFTVVDKNAEFVMDGFPRTTAQVDWLLNQTKHGQLDVTAVINIKATRGEVKNRLRQRGRLDDTDEALEQRFTRYESSMKPIIQHLKESKIPVLDIEGEGDVEEIHRSVLSAILPLVK
ncbi:MAG: nucleoside monophosphate kinase [bacterium]|nr:nucleoside monophosphate kinase [bacterium]